MPLNSTFIRKTQKNLHHGPPKLQNAINEYTISGELHRSKRISSNFDEEIPLIKENLINADYPLRCINGVVSEFQKCKECGDESFIIRLSFFEITKLFIFVEIPYCEMNEIKSTHFLKKFLKFTNNSFGMVITWKTRNIRSLFPLKDKNDYKWCVINKVIVLVVHVTLVKRNVMQKLDGRNIIIQLKFQNHQNTLEATSTPFLHGLSFQMLKKMLRPGRT